MVPYSKITELMGALRIILLNFYRSSYQSSVERRPAKGEKVWYTDGFKTSTVNKERSLQKERQIPAVSLNKDAEYFR